MPKKKKLDLPPDLIVGCGQSTMPTPDQIKIRELERKLEFYEAIIRKLIYA